MLRTLRPVRQLQEQRDARVVLCKIADISASAADSGEEADFRAR